MKVVGRFAKDSSTISRGRGEVSLQALWQAKRARERDVPLMHRGVTAVPCESRLVDGSHGDCWCGGLEGVNVIS